MRSDLRIIGIDCAVRANSVGLAVGTLKDDRITLDAVSVGRGKRTLREAMAVEIIGLVSKGHDCVVALDAPLGWPILLADALREHEAGQRLGDKGDADHYVYRRTDAVVFERLGIWPLDVGANYIARTAFAALELLDAIRTELPALRLLWAPGLPTGTGAIEVYPKATFVSRGLSVTDYKSSTPERAMPARKLLLESMKKELLIPRDQERVIIATDHALDAVACIIAAKDFIDQNVVVPTAEELESAKKEGWIWFRQP